MFAEFCAGMASAAFLWTAGVWVLSRPKPSEADLEWEALLGEIVGDEEGWGRPVAEGMLSHTYTHARSKLRLRVYEGLGEQGLSLHFPNGTRVEAPRRYAEQAHKSVRKAEKLRKEEAQRRARQEFAQQIIQNEKP